MREITKHGLDKSIRLSPVRRHYVLLEGHDLGLHIALGPFKGHAAQVPREGQVGPLLGTDQTAGDEQQTYDYPCLGHHFSSHLLKVSCHC